MDAHNSGSVLVTGGRGFIGRAAVKALQGAGCGVVSLDQAKGPAAHNQNAVEVLGDITDAADLQRVFESTEIRGLIHLAAILPTAAQRDPERATRVNVQGSLNLLEMAQRFGVRRMVFGSSLSIYGTWPAHRVVADTDRAAPEDLYGASKLYVEQLGSAYRAGCGLEFVSLRIGRVVGPGAESGSSAWRSQIFELLGTDRALEINLPYAGSERVLLVHVDDVAHMLVTLLQAPLPAHAAYNAPCESVVVVELKRELERLNSNIAVRLGEGYATGNPRLLDSSRFQREFDFQSVPIFERLQRAARASPRSVRGVRRRGPR
jgi:UDP-glucose 4-epimerase